MNAARIVDVAVGVLIRDDGDFLLAQRPAGKPYAGYWEFPGGKLEPGESVAQALHRELHEELGLDIGAVCPWVVREHVYPHAHVRLHFCRVFDWCGDAHGREGQAFGFFSLRRLPDGSAARGCASRDALARLAGAVPPAVGRSSNDGGRAERPGPRAHVLRRVAGRLVGRGRCGAAAQGLSGARSGRGGRSDSSRGRFPRRRGGRRVGGAGRLGDSRLRHRGAVHDTRIAASAWSARPRARDRVLAALVPVVAGLVLVIEWRTRNAVTLVGPGAEVDQTAALAAEWPERKGVAPLDVGAARRAFDDACHGETSAVRTRRARGRRERRAPAGAA